MRHDIYPIHSLIDTMSSLGIISLLLLSSSVSDPHLPE